ncbi:MAG: hypothetical protein AAF587_11500 [Bacteroidota bacterium]
MLRYLLLCLSICCYAACSGPQSAKNSATAPPMTNPPAEGFDANGSDAQAIEIADKVMESMGGRSAWDQTRFIKWTFFGFRTLTWDKLEGRVRIEIPRDSAVYLVNVFTKQGKAWEKGQAVTDSDSLALRMKKAESIWINDSYWLVMPFKLKDSGVTLKHLGEGSTAAGPAELLELTFKEVGVTPQNKYHVWVDKQTHLVNQWAFFRNADDPDARFTMPWLDYTPHGEILLSGDRGERKLENISVSQSMDDAVFEAL